MPVYEYLAIVQLGDGKTKKEKRYKFDYKKVVDGVKVHRRKQGFLTRDEALQEEFNDKQELIEPKEKKETITLDNLFALFMDYQATKLKPTTLENYRHIYEKYLSCFGTTALSLLSVSKVTKWKRKLVDEALSEDHTNKIINLLKYILEYGKRKGYLINDKLTDELEPIKLHTVPTERIAWNQDEVKQFFSTFSSDDIWYWFFRILLDSSCRPNEYRCLLKKDIVGQYLSIYKTCTSKVKGKGLIIQSPKTASSVRKVIMPKEDIDWLSDHTKDYEDNDFIFGKDTIFSESTIRRVLDKHIALSGVRHIPLYSFRHTSVTLLLTNTPLIVVSKRVGHSSVSTTMNHYWHLFNGDENKALDSLKSLNFYENTPKSTQE